MPFVIAKWVYGKNIGELFLLCSPTGPWHYDVRKQLCRGRTAILVLDFERVARNTGGQNVRLARLASIALYH